MQQGLGQIARNLVVDDVVDTDVLEKGTLSRTACRPYDGVTLELGDLAYDRSDGTGRDRTNTTSPGLSVAILSKPTQAVSPGMPAIPRNAWGGSPNVSSFCRVPAGALNRSRQPNTEETRSPGLNRGSSEAATSPIAPPSSASPRCKGR